MARQPDTAPGLRLPVLAKAAVSLCAAAAALNVVRLVDPNSPGHYPTCPFLAVTGWVCPGCGSLRALHALSVGDWSAAWAMNPALLVAAPFLVWTWAAWLWRSATGRPRRPLPSWVPVLTGGLVVLFGVLRNLPGFEFLGPV